MVCVKIKNRRTWPEHGPGWLVRSMLAQSRPLAMRKLSLRDPVLLNQSAGSTANRAGRETRQGCLYDLETQPESWPVSGSWDWPWGAGRSGSCGGGIMGPGWGDIGSRVGVCSGVMSWFGTRKLFASAGRQIKIHHHHKATHNITSNSSGHWERKKAQRVWVQYPVSAIYL